MKTEHIKFWVIMSHNYGSLWLILIHLDSVWVILANSVF